MIPRPNLEQVWIWFGIIAAVAVVEANTISVINYPDSGQASLTRYDYPLNYVGPCSCNTTQSSFPSAALSAAAYGSSIGSGPGCGRCFNLTLLHSLVSIPVYDLAGGGPSIVVRIEDKCPSPVNTDPGMTWCGATSTAHNMAGVDLHFDVASPSIGVPTSFFPVPSANYGYDYFGAFLVNYTVVSCEFWSGFDAASQYPPPSSANASSACCPLNPGFTDPICPATSLVVSQGLMLSHSLSLSFLAFTLAFYILSS